MIVRHGIVRRKLVSLALALFTNLENNGDADFERNGERGFLEALFRYLKESGRAKFVLLDVGANVGAYTRLLLDGAALLEGKGKLEVHAFEPAQESFESLRRGLSTDGRVILNRKAASNVNGTAPIFSDAARSPLASLHRRDLAALGLDLGGTETIETIRLEDYLKTRAIDHVDFLKLDVEGHVSLREIYLLFERAGFAVAKVMRDGLDVRPYQPWMENFQYANYVAISRKIVSGLP